MTAPLRGTELDDLSQAPAAEAAEAVERLAALTARLPACADPQVLAALARAMPARLSALAPEVALALQEVAVALAPCGLKVPADVLAPEAGLPPRLRVAWLRAALLAEPATVAAIEDEALLLAVVQGFALETLPGALPVLQRLAGARDARLRLAAVRAVPAAVMHLAVTGHEAFACVLPLAAGDEEALVRREALALLAQPWLVGLSLQARRRREQVLAEALRAPDEALALEAVKAAEALGLRDVLVEALAGELARRAEPEDSGDPAQVAGAHGRRAGGSETRPYDVTAVEGTESETETESESDPDPDSDSSLDISRRGLRRVRAGLRPARTPLTGSPEHGPDSALSERARLLPAVRRAALAALGSLAQRDDLELALGLAAQEPLAWGQAIHRFLLEAHRHGVFLREAHLPAVLELFDVFTGWTGEELVRVTYLARAALIARLAELPAEDARWRRRASILAASHGTAAPLLLAALLDRLDPATTDPRTALALLDAAGRCASFDAEGALLRWLPALPEAVLPSLRAKGGAASVAPLRELVCAPFTEPNLRAQALWTLWALAPDRPALLAELVARLPASVLPLTESRFAAQRDATLAELLLRAPAQQAELPALAQMELLCEAGQLRLLPEVTRLFREVLRGYVRKALEGDFTIKRLLVPQMEQMIFRYGRHVLKDGRPLRRWIEDGPETGRDLILRLVLDWLAEEPSDPIRVALLEIAARHQPHGATLRALEHHWRKGDANVRRAALELLAQAEGGARGLELSLGLLLTDTDDPRLLTQALAALANLRASWAEPLLRAALERPEMAVKKAAAEALAQVASARSLPAVLSWLARHDNDSFREPLQRALVAAAGPALVAVVLEAIDQLDGASAQPRATQLLWQVLSGRLPLPAVLQLARSSAPAHRALVEACVDGTVTVAGASRDQVAAALHRAQLRPRAPSADPAQRLRLEGFSVDAARQMVRERKQRRGEAADEAGVLAVVRAQLASWLRYLETPAALADDEAADAAELALAAAGPGELAEPALTLAERWHARVAPAAVVGFLERGAVPASSPGLRLRALTLLRALAPSAEVGGLRRFRLLGQLGALRTLADLTRALDECRLRPSLAGESFQLLCEAFAIPPQQAKQEPEALTALREQAAGWFRLAAPARLAWLQALAAQRPLELPLPADLPEPAPAPPFHASSRRDLRALLVTLRTGPAQERSRAAARLLAWPEAALALPALHGELLAGYLDGTLALAREDLPRLASGVVDGRALVPARATAEAYARARALAPHLAPWQRRAFLPQWLRAWEQGLAPAELLTSLDPQWLIPHLAARVAAGQMAGLELLRPSRAPAMAALLQMLQERAPEEAARLRAPRPRADEGPGEPPEGRAEPHEPRDPNDHASLAELLALLDGKPRRAGAGLGIDQERDKGLAVRAVHALTRFGDGAVAPLSRLAIDRRPAVRSAALRALRTVASREHTLQVTAQVLAMETRRDVTLQLLASLGHGRHLPALPELLERVTDRDPRIRRGASDALRAWGRDVIPHLRHAARRARPDKRRQYEALLAELE